MKIALLCLNEFGEECLKQLIDNSFKPLKVIVPRENRVNSIKLLCSKNNIPFIILNNGIDQIKKEITKSNLDIIVIASFNKILPEEIINYPKYGTINIHPSLLPLYRGAHPINWALTNDERRIGVTIHYLNKGVDTGNIIDQKVIQISNNDTIETLTKEISYQGSLLLIKILKKISEGKKRIIGIKQDNSKASYAPKRKPEDSKINWSNNTRDIFNLIRASATPYSAFSFTKRDEKIGINKSFIGKKPGKVLAKVANFYLVSTGDGVILIKSDKKISIGEILK